VPVDTRGYRSLCLTRRAVIPAGCGGWADVLSQVRRLRDWLSFRKSASTVQQWQHESMAIGDMHCAQSSDAHPAEDLKKPNPHRRSALVLGVGLIGGVLPQISSLKAQPGPVDGHDAWVIEVLKRMLTIKPGMTREALLEAFTTEGGLSTRLHQTFVSRDCPYFKVDIEFKTVGGQDRDDQGQVTLTEEDSRDLIVTISRLYLEFSIKD
jgi:hypothetical protein